jgi:drug/metabolite transporter (DMT)-like permease
VFREREKAISPAALKYVAYSAGVSTIGGMTFLLAAFAYTEIYKAVTISSLAPVLYIVIMTIFARDRFPVLAWCGTIIAVFGIGLSLS